MKVQVNMTFLTDRNMNDFRKKSITLLCLQNWRISVALAADDFHSSFLWVFAITFKWREIFARHFICNISVNMVKTSSQRKNQATFLLTFDFAEDELLGEFALEIFDKNSGSEPRAFSFAIPAATMTVGLLPEETWKSFLMNHCSRLDRPICRKGASSPGGKLFSVYRQNRRLQNGNLTNVW